jgi:hypothetical protein
VSDLAATSGPSRTKNGATARTAREGACFALLARRGCGILVAMGDLTMRPGQTTADPGDVDFEEDEPTRPSYLTRLAETPEGARVLARWMEIVEREEDGT